MRPTTGDLDALACSGPVVTGLSAVSAKHQSKGAGEAGMLRKTTETLQAGGLVWCKVTQTCRLLVPHHNNLCYKWPCLLCFLEQSCLSNPSFKAFYKGVRGPEPLLYLAVAGGLVGRAAALAQEMRGVLGERQPPS